MTLQTLYIYFCQFLQFFFAVPFKFHQVVLESSVFSHFQISPYMFNQVQVWALAWTLKDIYKVAPCYLDCVLMTTSPVDELSRLLWSRYSSRMSLYIAVFIFPLILSSHSVFWWTPADWHGVWPFYIQAWFVKCCRDGCSSGFFSLHKEMLELFQCQYKTINC